MGLGMIQETNQLSQAFPRIITPKGCYFPYPFKAALLDFLTHQRLPSMVLWLPSSNFEKLGIGSKEEFSSLSIRHAHMLR